MRRGWLDRLGGWWRHQHYANTTPASLIKQAAKIGRNAAILIERLMRDRPHPQQGYRAAQGVLSLARRYGPERLEAACDRALTINATSYSSVSTILKSGLDQAVGKSRHQLFEAIERDALAPLPATPFEYSEWKSAKVHPDYHVEVDKAFYSVPHVLGMCSLTVT